MSTEGLSTVPTDTASTKLWGLRNDAADEYQIPRRTKGKGWWTGGYASVVTDTIVRPANTTAYAAGDVISTTGGEILEFTGMAARNGASGLITTAHLIINTNQATDLVADLILFDTTLTVVADNAAMVATDGEAVTYCGVIQFTTPVDLGANNVAYTVTGLNLRYVCTASSTSIFGLLVARNAYTPASGDTFTIRLVTDLD